MRHARPPALAQIAELLDQIRKRSELREKKLGIFYWKSRSFLHFHEDPAGMFADVGLGNDFDRLPVNTRGDWKKLLAAIDRALKG